MSTHDFQRLQWMTVEEAIEHCESHEYWRGYSNGVLRGERSCWFASAICSGVAFICGLLVAWVA